ncbi:MAG: glycoside hydrolase family 1 protein [Lachnospiraceae bacterium]
MAFPKGFLIGAATAAHQVEGNNTNSDDWALEQLPHGGFPEKSGIACDQYNRYEEDIRMMARAGLNAYRFSIEWARVEPKQGVFDHEALEHYRQEIACCRRYGLEPIVTLMHFTSPVWVIQKGGWENEEVVDWFRSYVTAVMQYLGQDLRFVVTINEANMRVQIADISARYLAQMKAAAAAAGKKEGEAREGQVQVGLNLKDLMAGQKAAAEEKAAVFGTPDPRTFVSPCTPEGDILVMKAHQAAVEVIRSICPNVQVGLSLSLHDVQPVQGVEEAANKLWEREFTHYLPYISGDDFLGVQNYTRTLYGPEGPLPVPEGAETTQMGYEFYPEGLGHVLRRAAGAFPGRLLVTENGIATENDTRRCAFIRTALQGVEEAAADGIPVFGYLHWSLLDNFEWQKGYAMKFGLVSVNRNTMARIPKESLALLGSFAKSRA